MGEASLETVLLNILVHSVKDVLYNHGRFIGIKYLIRYILWLSTSQEFNKPILNFLLTFILSELFPVFPVAASD